MMMYQILFSFRYSPIGILFLVASEIVNMKDPVAELESLGLYIGTVLAGLCIHGFIILPLLYFIFVRKNPIIYIYGILQAMATALGTASRYCVLNINFTVRRDNFKIISVIYCNL